jgi:hypothetical protein
MSSFDEIFGKPNGPGGDGSGIGRQRKQALQRQAQAEQEKHEQELAKQEPIQDTLPDGKDVVLSHPRWDHDKAFFMQKVKATVDVAIPASRGGASRIVFELFAMLPKGVKSARIASAEGHPDKEGMATVEWTLFYPNHEERVIVKPVESYAYFFTAKHKYSKEIQSPDLRVVDHSVSTVQFLPENINIDLPMGIGDIHGSITEYRFDDADLDGNIIHLGGVAISLEFRNRNQQNRINIKSYKWKQKITTSSPIHGRKKTYSDVLDTELRKYENGHEFWYGDGEDREYVNPIYNISDGAYFKDTPYRPFLSDTPTTWVAALSLYGIDATGAAKELGSIVYGFTLEIDKRISFVPPKIRAREH